MIVKQRFWKSISRALEIQNRWHVEEAEILPVLISSTGLIPKRLHENVAKLGLPKIIYIEIQKTWIHVGWLEGSCRYEDRTSSRWR